MKKKSESNVMRLKHYFKANIVKETNPFFITGTVIGLKTLSVFVDRVLPVSVDFKDY